MSRGEAEVILPQIRFAYWQGYFDNPKLSQLVSENPFVSSEYGMRREN